MSFSLFHVHSLGRSFLSSCPAHARAFSSPFIFPLCFFFFFFKLPPYHWSPILCMICLVSNFHVRGTSTFVTKWQNSSNEKREKHKILRILSLILQNNWFLMTVTLVFPLSFVSSCDDFWSQCCELKSVGRALGQSVLVAELQNCKSGHLHNAHPALLHLGCSAQLFPLDFISATWRQL